MIASVSLALFVLACAGLATKVLQTGAVVWFRRRRPVKLPLRWPGISVLKPLCGVDDSLADNLALFAELPYPTCEVLLGVRDKRDPAYALAKAAEDKWPDRFRVVVQQGAPGLNPKVNQLITLSRAAKHDILVVSDSNVRVSTGYLPEIACLFEDEQVGLVTHAVAGAGEERLGALMDNLFITVHVSAGVVGAKVVAGKDIVVGKSMAFRRRDLVAMGGFESAQDVLAEDYTMGLRVASELGKRVALAHEPIVNVMQRKSVSEFLQRYQRWAVMQRRAVTLGSYLAQILLYPVALACLGLALHPTADAAAAFAGVCLAKTALDAVAARSLREGGFALPALMFVPCIDLLAAKAWLHGLLTDRVEWRGTQLRVVEGTRLVPVDAVELPAAGEVAPMA